MPNFNITRKIEDSDNYGCNCFATNQKVGQIASSGGLLDGDIIWYLDANPGYTVSISDFDIPNTSPTNVPQTATQKTFKGPGVPSPLLGIAFEQLTVTRIKITLYLYPNSIHGITGSAFVMPVNNVSRGVDIIGCANLAGESHNFKVICNHGENGAPTKNVTVDPDHASVLSVLEASSHEHHVNGVITNISDGDAIFTYEVTAPFLKRFVSVPSINMSTSSYHYSSVASTNSDGYITSVLYTIFKGGGGSTNSTNTNNITLGATGAAATANNSYSN
jgi:hypothetical protein